MDGIKSLFDPYARVARTYPAIVTAAPLLWTAGIAIPSVIASAENGALTVLLGAALLYLMASLARMRGRIVEVRLLERWGGWPTSILLRHRDRAIDTATKSRYHAALQAMCPDLKMPSLLEEQSDANAADRCFRSATKRLIENRRGDAWPIILHENASYGFRRNLLGMRSIGVAIALLTAAATIAYWWYQGGMPHNFSAALAVADVWPGPLALAAFDLIYAVLWCAVVSERWVRYAAMEYAMAVLRSLDAPQNA